jgi:hypothetical protein
LRPTPAFVLAFIALCLALSGSAVAARSLISGSQIKNGSISTDDIKDGSLLAKDFKKGQVTAGPKAEPGAAGPAGSAGAPGKDGKDGKDGTTPALSDRGTVVTDAGSGPLQSVDVAWVRSTPGGAAVLTLTFTRETDGLSAQLMPKLLSSLAFAHVDDQADREVRGDHLQRRRLVVEVVLQHGDDRDRLLIRRGDAAAGRMP